MVSKSIINNKELTRELLESDYFQNSNRLKKAGIDPEQVKEYLQKSVNKSPEEARKGLGEVEAIALDAIIKLAERPAIKIQNNSFESPRSQYWKDRLEPHRITIDRAIKSVGRIELENHPQGFAYVGTGWLVADDIIVTNRHVAQTFAMLQSGTFVRKQNPFTSRFIESSIDFREEYQIPNEEEFNIDTILYIEPESGSDIAFLKVKRKDDTVPRNKIPLAGSIPPSGSEIVVIGYPARDSQRNPLEPSQLLEIFEDIYDVKRLQPGEILSTASVRGSVPVFTHDCSTLGGNSGSVVLDIKTGEAVGLHFGGVFQEENYAVPSTVIKQRLNDLLSGKLTSSLSKEIPTIVAPITMESKIFNDETPIILETVDNETPIELEDTPCLSPLEDENLEDSISEAVPFPSVNIQIPLLGTGYYCYATFRDKQFGLPETIKALEEIGEMWFNNHRGGPLIGVGNISKQGGGPVPPHSSHQTGLDVDFRLLRTDGARIGITFRSPSYSRSRTQELVNIILSNPILKVKLILCNDNKLKGVQPWPGHDDHLHVRFQR